MTNVLRGVVIVVALGVFVSHVFAQGRAESGAVFPDRSSASRVHAGRPDAAADFDTGTGKSVETGTGTGVDVGTGRGMDMGTGNGLDLGTGKGMDMGTGKGLNPANVRGR